VDEAWTDQRGDAAPTVPSGAAPGRRRAAIGGLWTLDLVPLGLLALAAWIRPLSIPVLAVLVLGLIDRRHDARGRGAPWAGAIPVATSLAWSLIPLPAAATDGSTCGAFDAPFATYRLAEALIALAVLVGLVPIVGGGGADLGLRWPARRVGVLALAAFCLAGPLGLLLGPSLAAPFFGSVALRLDDPGALIPAFVFALSNGIMEELLYRGALQGWTARRTGPAIAIAGQAVVFGLAHAAGPDVGGSPVVLGAALTAGGAIAGWIVWRTGSLLVPIAAHIGLDVPLYFGNACRL
jgi:membrane protease YdiL (CAAX protease family)